MQPLVLQFGCVGYENQKEPNMNDVFFEGVRLRGIFRFSMYRQCERKSTAISNPALCLDCAALRLY